MSIRFHRSVKVAPGLRLNLSKGALGLTAGAPGMRFGVNSKGRVGTTLGLPGTGFSYREYFRNARRRTGARTSHSAIRPLACLRALIFGPRADRAFVRGVLRLLNTADTVRALAHFRRAFERKPGTSVALFAGYCASKGKDSEPALEYLRAACASPLPDRMHRRYLIGPLLPVPLTPLVTVNLPATGIAAALLYASVLHQTGRTQEAIEALDTAEDAPEDAPEDRLVVRTARVFLYCEAGRYDDVIALTDKVRNEDDATAHMLVCRAQAMAARDGCEEPALQTFKEALRTRARNIGILNDGRYRRALFYERLGQDSKAQADLKAVYAADSGYADVAERLARADHDPAVEAAVTRAIADPGRMGEFIRDARKAAGLTQRRLSLLSGISPTMLSFIENGTANPKRKTIEQLMQIIRVKAPDGDSSSSDHDGR